MSKIRPGIGGTLEFPPVPGLLSKKPFARHNILVGNDAVQTRFAEQTLGVECKVVDRVKDEDVLVPDPTLHQVLMSNSIDLSPELRNKAGIWSLTPITPGSAAATSIIKAACEILDVKLEIGKRNRACEILTKEVINDVRAALWNAIWIVAGEIPEDVGLWKDPWAADNWMPNGIDPRYRLNALYRELVGYIFVCDNDEASARRFGISPAKIKRLKALNLDIDRVYDSLLELSRWRSRRYDPYICALKITSIWKS
jgi:hypothetical protein